METGKTPIDDHVISMEHSDDIVDGIPPGVRMQDGADVEEDYEDVYEDGMSDSGLKLPEDDEEIEDNYLNEDDEMGDHSDMEASMGGPVGEIIGDMEGEEIVDSIRSGVIMKPDSVPDAESSPPKSSS